MAIVKNSRLADHLEIDYLIELCKKKFFTDDDGYGHPSNGIEMDDEEFIYPSDIIEENYDKRITMIVWFQRKTYECKKDS